MEEIWQWFLSFPRYLQLFILVALATPLLVLHRYLNPPPPPSRPLERNLSLPDRPLNDSR
jgi:hypothetical protein